MTDYIRRDTAIKLMKKEAAEMSESFEELGGESGIYADAYEDAANMLQDMPAADVAEVVHAKWIPFHSEAAGDIQYCSACDIGFDARMDYCPHCGARMDGWMEDADNG
jgi:hypothetical protein